MNMLILLIIIITSAITSWNPSEGEPEALERVSLHLAIAHVVVDSEGSGCGRVVVECPPTFPSSLTGCDVTQPRHYPPTITHLQTTRTVGTAQHFYSIIIFSQVLNNQ